MTDFSQARTGSRDASLTESGDLAGVFMLADPRWSEKIYFGGMLLLLAPPVGWPAAMGFRKELIARLFSGDPELLPDWKRGVGHYFVEGLKASGVIFTYFLPLYLLLFAALFQRGIWPDGSWFWTALSFLIFPIFAPLSFPLAVIYWGFLSVEEPLELGAVMLFLGLFAAVTFFIPAAFLQVSRTGRYRSAFSILKAGRLIVGAFPAYCRAWHQSIVMSFVGHFALPFAPWGVVWCYLGIIYAFNSLLEEELRPAAGENPSWFHRLREENAFAVRQTSVRRIYRLLKPLRINQTVLLFRLGPIFAPIPARAAAYLFPEAVPLRNT